MKELQEEYNVFIKIQDYSSFFKDRSIKIVDDYEFNQLRQVKDNHLYYTSNFIEGDKGDRRFYNIIKPACRNESKNIDLDTKDINIYALSEDNMTKAWLLKRFIAQWGKKNNLGQKFNEFTDKLPIYGSVVAKRVYDGEIFKSVNLRLLENDPTTDKLANSWSIEHFWYSPSELLKQKGKWDSDEIDKAIENFKQTGRENYVGDYNADKGERGDAQYIHVVEFRDDMPNYAIKEDGGDEWIRGRFVCVLAESEGADGLVLFRDKLRPKDEYKECHRDKEEGRWLGVGIPEDLTEAQILKNEEMNYMRDALKLSSMILLQTKDTKVARNILTDLMNGDILRVQSEIQRVPLEVRNLGEKQQVSLEISNLVNSLANMPEVTTGESLPSGTPYRLGELLNRNANKLFDYIREKLGLFYKELFQDWIAEELKKEINKKNILRLFDKDEIKQLARELSKAGAWDAVKRYMIETGNKPSKAQVEEVERLIEQRYAGKDAQYLDLDAGELDFDYGIEFEFTGESLDPNIKLKTLTTLLQMLGANPTLLDNPIFAEILNLTGMSKIDVASFEGIAQVQPQVGQTNQITQTL